ncbi:MAG TPA: hypothetical protein VKV95_01405 [Terriglobia bacterium]|nr:hypothetical protein [Terriglobia bacterium]
MSKPKMAAGNGRDEFRDPSPALRDQEDMKHSGRDQDDTERSGGDQHGKKREYPRHRHNYAYRSSSRVDRLDEGHPGMRALVETLLRKRVRQGEIARQVYQKFGVRISTTSLSRFFLARIQPKEDAEASAFREAHAQARALIEEMKADPSLDAAQIAEIMLANQIVQDRTKLAEADIMDLYREQRERRKLELQQRTFLLKEKQTLAVLEKLKGQKKTRPSQEEMVREIAKIYGLAEPSPAVDVSQ